MAPATCLMNCAAQAITMSTTTTQLSWASGIPLSPATPTTNRMVSTELAPYNEQGASGDNHQQQLQH
jgi:hypothetical protein